MALKVLKSRLFNLELEKKFFFYLKNYKFFYHE